ncbi:MAG TPA: deoxyhypusine synthase family protein [Myxococcota bacterium]|jgi:deoxyhypusine synthase|nr:deoxyhypusine synthase family protein [Myxococcota bacterium]
MKGAHDHPQHSKRSLKAEELANGYSDGLEPVVPLDLSRIDSFSDLLHAYARTSFGARQLGEAADVLLEMVQDPDCLVVGTFSGAMTVAKMGLVLCDMIDHGMLDAIVSTGALMCHGFVEAAGLEHFKWREGMDDTELYEKGYNRVYDTLEPELNLDKAEVIIAEVLKAIPPGTTTCSSDINRRLGEHLAAKFPGQRGILKSAFERGVPVYVPAFTDSELGLDVALHNRRLKLAGQPPLRYDPYEDLEAYTAKMKAAKRVGIFTIGGGVPRNWAQQVGPYLDLIDKRVGTGGGFLRFQYGVRICPEPAHWGGLSGCPYSEGVSWGKFAPREEGGRYAEVPSDATLVWPLLVKAVLERLAQAKK